MVKIPCFHIALLLVVSLVPVAAEGRSATFGTFLLEEVAAHPVHPSSAFLPVPDPLAPSFPLLAAAAAAGEDPPVEPRGAAAPWSWRRAAAVDYAGVAILGAGAVFVESEYGRPEAKWKAHNWFDESIRDALRLHGRDARETAHTVGDVLMWGMIVAPVLDSAATLGGRDGAWDALWQTEMVNLESYAFTSFVSALLQTVIAREKPFKRNCVDGRCEGDQENRSMPSGHVAFALTGAGLVCNHHRYQSLYRDPASDRAACLTGIGLAAADGVARIMADHHYATDVFAGATIGFFSGFILPRLLYYSHPMPSADVAGKGPSIFKQVSFIPMLSNGAPGLSCAVGF